MVFGYGWKEHFALSQIPNLSGKTAIVTGSNSGVGKQTALNLAKNGADVILACRNASKAEQAAKDITEAIQSSPNAGKVEVGQLDLSDLDSVKKFAQGFIASGKPLSILVLNAALVPPSFTLTKHSFETTYTTNHVSHSYLTSLLFPSLLKEAKEKREARVVVVAADVTGWMDWTRLNGGKEWCIDEKIINDPKSYNGARAYLRTKIHNVLFTRYLTSQIPTSTPIYINAIHPGVVGTEIFFPSSHSSSSEGSSSSGPGVLEKFGKWVMSKTEGNTHLNAEDGSRTSLYAATSQEVVEQGFKGHYFFPFGIDTEPAPILLDEDLQKQSWELTRKIVKKETGDGFFEDLTKST